MGKKYHISGTNKAAHGNIRRLCSIANPQGKQQNEIARQIASGVVSHLTVGKVNQGDSKATDLVRVLGTD